jgi:hypothetical protein
MANMYISATDKSNLLCIQFVLVSMPLFDLIVGTSTSNETNTSRTNTVSGLFT